MLPPSTAISKGAIHSEFSPTARPLPRTQTVQRRLMERTIEIATVSIGAGLMSATRVGRGTVLSSAATNATVSLWADNGSFTSTYRRNDFFRGELSLNNSTGSLWLTITNVGVLRNGTNSDIVTNIIGSSFIPQTHETFGYDLYAHMKYYGYLYIKLIGITMLSE